MFKVIGVVTFFGAVALAAAVYMGVLDFDANATVTPKGEQQIQELRNQTADAIRGAGNTASEAVRTQGK